MVEGCMQMGEWRRKRSISGWGVGGEGLGTRLWYASVGICDIMMMGGGGWDIRAKGLREVCRIPLNS